MYINMNITHIAKRNALIDKVISTMPKISLDNKKELTNKAIRILQDRLEQIVPKTYEDSKHIKPVISEIFHFQKSLKTKLGHCLEEMAAVINLRIRGTLESEYQSDAINVQCYKLLYIVYFQ